jgi:hypothetical protein
MCRKLFYPIVAGAVLALTASVDAQEIGKGKVLFEYWYNIGGTSVDKDLRTCAGFPDGPDGSEWRDNLQSQANRGDNYGLRARAFLIPPETGEYTFWVAGDDNCQLWLSRDADPANAMLIAQVPGWTGVAQWNKYPQQKSAPLLLAGGQTYYIEALMKEGSGDDSLDVGWAGPGIGSAATVLAGRYCMPFVRTPEPLVMPRNPDPPNGAVNVRDMPTLGWTPGATAVWQFVYLGTDAGLVSAGDASALIGMTERTTLSLAETALDRSEQYYWKTDALLADGSLISGPLWSFTVVDTGIRWGDVTRPGDTIRGEPNDARWQPDTIPSFAIDDKAGTDHFHYFDAIEGPIGLLVTPSVGPTLVTGLTFMSSARFSSKYDPVSFELSGSNWSIDGPYTVIAGGPIVDFARSEEWPRFTKTTTPILFENKTVYRHYRLLFTNTRGGPLHSLNSIQIAQDVDGVAIAEAELLGQAVCESSPCHVYLAGIVRNVLDGRPVRCGDQGEKVKITRKPCEGSGSHTHYRDPNWYEIRVAEGPNECWNISLEATGFCPAGSIPVTLMEHTHTLRDFVLWPTLASLPVLQACPVYRFRWRSGPSSYYFTADTSKRDDLLFDDVDPANPPVETRDPNNWMYNGIAFCALAPTNDPKSAVYCFVRKNDSKAIPAYAFSKDCLETLNAPDEWLPRPATSAAAFYAYPSQPEHDPNAVPIYRFWSASSGSYFYTTDRNERNTWENPGDWEDRDIAWYAYDRPEQ